MFKWLCLLIAIAGLGAFLWMVNDVRLEVKRVTSTIDNKLPGILDNTDKAATTVDKHLPGIIEDTEKSVQSLAEVSQDLKNYSELFGDVYAARQNKDTLIHAQSVLDLIAGQQNAKIGVKKPHDGKELVAARDAQQWANRARKVAPLLSILSKSKPEMLSRLSTAPSGLPWYIQVGEKAPMLLQDWVKANHEASKGL
jgi:hypothetical protein